MIRRVASRVLLLGALSALGLGCVRAPLDPPVIPLDPSEQNAVVACQSTISEQVVKLTASATQQLNRCARAALDLRLEEERVGVDSSNIGEFLAKLERVESKCDQAYERIGRASTRMVDAVIGRCQRVESLILAEPLRGDPLAWKGELDFDGLGSISGPTTVPQLAGSMCSVALGSAELMVAFSFPRTGDLISRYYGFTDDDEWSDFRQAAVDPRCDGLPL